MSEYIPKDERVFIAPELPVDFLAGDIVTRDGTDEHVVVRSDPGDNMMLVRCIKEPNYGFDEFSTEPWCVVGDEEFNLKRRYELVRPGPLRVTTA